jgi:hypothetical protein
MCEYLYKPMGLVGLNASYNFLKKYQRQFEREIQHFGNSLSPSSERTRWFISLSVPVKAATHKLYCCLCNNAQSCGHIKRNHFQKVPRHYQTWISIKLHEHSQHKFIYTIYVGHLHHIHFCLYEQNSTGTKYASKTQHSVILVSGEVSRDSFRNIVFL